MLVALSAALANKSLTSSEVTESPNSSVAFLIEVTVILSPSLKVSKTLRDPSLEVVSLTCSSTPSRNWSKVIPFL